MSKEKSLIVLEESILKKIIKFVKNIFVRKNKTEETNIRHSAQEQKEKFMSNLQESTNTEKTIEKVLQDISLVYSMSIDELKELNKAIKIRQKNLEQKVMELKVQISSLE